MAARPLLRRMAIWLAKCLLVLGTVIGAGIFLLTLIAEYYYLRISLGEGEVAWFDTMELMGPIATPVLIRVLKDRDSFDRWVAAKKLGAIGDSRATSPLMEVAANEADLMVQVTAVRALANIGDPRALPLLRQLSWTNYSQDPRLDPRSGERSDIRIDNVALDALRLMGEGGKEALLEYFRTHPDPRRRAIAVEILCRAPLDKDPQVREEIKTAVSNPSWEVRSEVARWLRQLLGREAIPLLRPLLEDPSAEVRAQASQELGRLGDRSGYRVAMEILVDRSLSDEVRGNAARALGDIKDRDALPVLKEIMDSDPSNVVRADAKVALQWLFPGGIPRDNSSATQQHK